MSETTDCLVIGGGVVGLAVARAVALTGASVIVLERNDAIGQETSSRNSEVVHAGIYYVPGSLKAQLCVAGKRQLYDYCDEKGIDYRRCAKLIVAVDDAQRVGLDRLAANAAASGIDDLERLDRADVTAVEPEIDVAGGLMSPSTGIVDSHGLMVALAGDIENAGGIVAPLGRFVGAEPAPAGLAVTIDSDGDETRIAARRVVNATGLAASAVAAAFPADARPDPIPRQHFAKGNYFAYAGPSPFSHLIYPLPVDGGLGVHATMDLAGRLRFGPDVEWVDTLDYGVDADRADSFYALIRTYWPALGDGMLTPDYAGIRPKLSAPGEPAADFGIVRTGAAVHLFGIESPGLTACLALGDHVVGLLDGR